MHYEVKMDIYTGEGPNPERFTLLDTKTLDSYDDLISAIESLLPYRDELNKLLRDGGAIQVIPDTSHLAFLHLLNAGIVVFRNTSCKDASYSTVIVTNSDCEVVTFYVYHSED